MAVIVNLESREEFSKGANSILHDIRDSWDDADPWGSGMGWLFALGDVYYCITGETLPNHQPSIALNGFDDLDLDDWATDCVVSDYVAGWVNQQDIAQVFMFLSDLDDTFRDMGLNY